MAAYDCDNKSTDYLPLEYSPQGGADLRITGLSGVHNDGSSLTVLRFCDYEILNSKPKLEGLPSTYAEEGDKVETLTIHLKDSLKNLDVYLNYSVFEDLDAITRSVKIVNNGERFRLNTVFSATVDFYGLPKSDMIHLDGCWEEKELLQEEILFTQIRILKAVRVPVVRITIPLSQFVIKKQPKITVIVTDCVHPLSVI